MKFALNFSFSFSVANVFPMDTVHPCSVVTSVVTASKFLHLPYSLSLVFSASPFQYSIYSKTHLVFESPDGSVDFNTTHLNILPEGMLSSVILCSPQRGL